MDLLLAMANKTTFVELFTLCTCLSRVGASAFLPSSSFLVRKRNVRNHSKSLIKFNYTLTENVGWHRRHSHRNSHSPTSTITTKPNEKPQFIRRLSVRRRTSSHKTLNGRTRKIESNERVTVNQGRWAAKMIRMATAAAANEQAIEWILEVVHQLEFRWITHKQNMGKYGANIQWKYVPSMKTFPFRIELFSQYLLNGSACEERIHQTSTITSSVYACVCLRFHSKVFVRIVPQPQLKKLITFRICDSIIIKRFDSNLR